MGLLTYACNPAACFHWACWDDEYVVFEETSGQTQVMGPLRAYVLNALSASALRFDAIVEQLADVPGLAGETELTELLSAVLNDLVRHGFVEVAAV